MKKIFLEADKKVKKGNKRIDEFLNECVCWRKNCSDGNSFTVIFAVVASWLNLITAT